jgi:hypothetical protein
MYRLPSGYSQAGDNDIQESLGDEIVPVKDKPQTPEDALPLVGVLFEEMEVFTPILMSEGLQTAVLIPSGQQFQGSSLLDENIYAGTNLSFTPVVKDGTNIIAPSGYIATPSGLLFLNEPYPVGFSIEYYKTGTGASDSLIGSMNSWYSGNNRNFNARVIDSSGVMAPEDYVLDLDKGLVTLTAPASGIMASYAHEAQTTRYFVGDSGNWINEHLYMSPDIFKGEFDYPGDDTIGPGGVVVTQEEIPKFVEQSEYQIDYRRGLVTFSSEIDCSANPAKANYAHMAGTMNATSQSMTPVGVVEGRFVYKAVSDNANPWSIGSRWVGRDNVYTPVNIYVDEELKPTIRTVAPEDTILVVKT